MDLLTPIYESNDENFIRALSKLPSLRENKLGASEAHMFGSILAKRGNVKKQNVDLFDCGLNDIHMEIISQNMTGHRLQVRACSFILLFTF